MVELVRHALVHGAVHLDVDVLPDLVGSAVGGEVDVTLLPEPARDQVARPRPQTMARRQSAPPASIRAAAAGVRWMVWEELGFARAWHGCIL